MSGVSQDEADEKATTPIDSEGYALAALRGGLAASKTVAIVSMHPIWSTKLIYGP